MLCGHHQLPLEPTAPVPLENTEEVPQPIHLALQLPEHSDKDMESKSTVVEGTWD
jgi:hypothetical protein